MFLWPSNPPPLSYGDRIRRVTFESAECDTRSVPRHSGTKFDTLGVTFNGGLNQNSDRNAVLE